MLNLNEKEYLYEIISAVLGYDPSIKTYMYGFNENTVEVVERLIEVDTTCNSAMKELLSDLLLTGTLRAKGWLRKVLKTQRKILKKSDLNGAGCLVTVKSRWKSVIIASAI